MDLARTFAPKNLDEIVGQKEIINAFKTFIKADKIPHSLFFGPPGCGKTTLAKLIATQKNYEFYSFDASNLKLDEIRKILSNSGLFTPLIFIDEFHRLNKTQQDALLVPIENGECVLMGASTQNPKFSVTSGIRSRVMVFEFKHLSAQDLEILINKIKSKLDFSIDDDAQDYLINSSSGDARSLLNLLDYALILNKHISLNTLKTLRQSYQGEGVNSKDCHYELISALIKSMRGSDIDAGLYYLARLLNAGEDAAFVARRFVIFASEDIGNANPNALNLAVSTMQAVSKIGMPEASIILAQCLIYLSSSPKSNASYLAIKQALKFVKEKQNDKIPPYLINHDTQIQNYLYPHDFGGWVEQDYLPKELKNLSFYQSKQIAFEKTLSEWLANIKRKF
mgnify:FL=1